MNDNKKRRSIKISVDDELYNLLQSIKDNYGFKNVCEFNTALLNLLCQYIEAAEKRGNTGKDNRTDSEMITDMFNDLGNWERTPDGVVPVRHKKNINIK